MNIKTLAAFALLVLGLFSFSSWHNSEAQPPRAIEQFMKVFCGVYSNEKAIANAPMKMPVQNMVGYRIWKNQPDVWLYFGWYSPQMKQKSLDECIFRVYMDGEAMRVDWYKIPNRERFSQEWLKKRPFEGLSPVDLGESPAHPCKIEAIENGGYRFYSDDLIEQREQPDNAAYKFVKFDMSFFPNGFRPQTSFYDANRQAIPMPHFDFFIDKIETNPKKF